jgi:uncharacterized protein YjbI with pentapeptide repeats
VRAWFRRYRTVLVVASAVVLVAAFAVLVWRGASWLDASRLKRLTPVQQESAIDAIRGRLLQLGAGLVVSAGLVYTALNFRLSRESHVTDRFTKAIEQLGSERLDVRLGAIYALERIMIDSPRDHPTIVEVLAAFVREHSLPDLRSDTELLAAATVLGRRPSGREERGPLNLKGAYLPGVRLERAQLPSAILVGADLTRAGLHAANLSGAFLAGARLMAVNMFGADLVRANLTGAILAGADLAGVRLEGAVLDDADLEGAHLEGAILSGASLAGADLTGADLTAATLSGSFLSKANLTAANLSDANLTGAIVEDVILADANLEDANLTAVILPASALANPSLPDRFRPKPPPSAPS